MHIQVSTVVRAPKATVVAVYADYGNWPRVFPTIHGVRLRRREGRKLVLDIDHVEGKVVNELTVTSSGEIELWEMKPRYQARFCNRFQTVPAGTRFTVTGDIRLKGAARLLSPFLRGLVRTRMERLQLQPVKATAERRAASTAPSSQSRQGGP